MYFGNPNDPETLLRTVHALRHALLSVIEEVSVMKAMLETKGLWDAAPQPARLSARMR